MRAMVYLGPYKMRVEEEDIPKIEQPGMATGAHWDFAERQARHGPREMSIEHGTMPPVFGTSAPRQPDP